jgi:hypothetical protein
LLEPRWNATVDRISVYLSVIPAEARNPGLFESKSKSSLDAGLRRHDNLPVKQKVGLTLEVLAPLEAIGSHANPNSHLHN